MMNILIVSLLGALLFFAIYRRRSVRVGMKVLGVATFFIEASDEPPRAQPDSVPNGKLIERTGA